MKKGIFISLRALNFSKLSERSYNYGLFKVNFWGSGGVTPSVKRGYAKLSLLIFLLLCLSCAYDQDIKRLNEQIAYLQTRIDTLEKAIEEDRSAIQHALEERLSKIHSSQAEFSSEIDTLKGSIRDLSGKVDENRQLIRHSIEKDLNEQDVIQNAVLEVSKRLTQLEERIKRGESWGAPTISPQKTEASLTEDELYQQSLNLFRDGRYEEALKSFQALIDAYPQSCLLDNVYFWMGECYLRLNRFEKAILSYQKVIKDYPKSDKIPRVFIRQARAFMKLDDKISAKILLKKAINRFPDSPDALEAQKILRGLR